MVHLLSPPKWQAEEMGACRLLNIDNKDEADGDDG
jgi:hypothetical protein